MENRYGWDKEFMAVGVILLVLMLSVTFIRADEDGGVLPDPKDMAQAEAPRTCDNDITFLPLPRWASAKMPALPAALTPMGAVANKAKPSPAAVAETKPDAPPMPKKLPQVYPLASSSTPAPAASNEPALIAVSPFLQWIKDHPAEAAAAARKDAQAYGTVPAVGTAPGVVAGPNGAEPYWMPPMIDTSSTVQAGDSAGGSAAIYSTPQR